MSSGRASAMPAAAEVACLIDQGHHLSQVGQLRDAEIRFRQAIALCDDHPIAHNNLAWVREMQGDVDGAITGYRRALALAPDLRIARRNLALLLIRCGCAEESLELWYTEAATAEGCHWIDERISEALIAHDLLAAGDIAHLYARIRWGSDWYPVRGDRTQPLMPPRTPDVLLSVPKLRHDIDQMSYLQERGVLGREISSIIAAYERVAERVTAHGPEARVPLDAEAERTIGLVYGRILHVRPTPRVARALSNRWDPAQIEAQYLGRPPGVVVVDDFLSSDALDGLRAYCLESTVWSANRYTYGRLGAFFRDGFHCPLLLQIAQELRAALPRVIGDRHPLRQLWGFKNDHTVPGDATVHADFAAVNVNFWITPDDANLDPATGGLVVYEVDAPLDWDFWAYNADAELIRAFLARNDARSITIPYRANRAIIFNSDLFHCTSALRFRPGYQHRRVNITMLYGQREDDMHHRQMSREWVSPRSWRSASFARVRSG